MSRNDPNHGHSLAGAPSDVAARRIREVDAIRGFALCGIIFVNIVDVTRMPMGCEDSDGGFACSLFEATLYHRFYPIFSLLFGLSSALFLSAAARRTSHPRLVLLARFGFLLPFGLAHSAMQPGEVLLIYAFLGVVVLLPASLIPRFAVLLMGGIATVAGILIPADRTLSLIPGMLLLGFAATLYKVPHRLAGHARVAWITFGISCLLAAALGFLQAQQKVSPSSSLFTVAGLVYAIAYTSGAILLLGTRARKPLLLSLEPLGRMALTNYVMATVIILLADRWLKLADDPSYGAVVLLGTVILSGQAVASMLWLRSLHYGPLEWLWRCMTWWRWIPNRR